MRNLSLLALVLATLPTERADGASITPPDPLDRLDRDPGVADNRSEAVWGGPMDPVDRERFQRTLNIAGAGSVLLQTSINKAVQQLSLRELGVQAALDRKPGSGNAAYINRRTPGTTGGSWVDDVTEPTEETGTYAQTSFPYRSLVTRGKVTRALVAKGKSYGDVLATELGFKTEDYSDQYEFGLVSGDSGAAGNANQINGLLTLINAVSGQVVAATTAAGGDSFTLSQLDKTIDLVRGSGNRDDLIIVGSMLGLRKLNALLQANQRFLEVGEIAAGFRVRMYDGIAMIRSTRMPDVLTWSGSTITALTGGGTTALAVINKRYMWIEELTPMTVLPLARASSQYDQFDIYSDMALVLSNTKGAALLAGITTTGA